MLEEEVPRDSNIISVSFVVAFKDVDTDQLIINARFVPNGYSDSQKHQLVYDSTSARQSSVRFFTAMAALAGFDV